MSVVGLCGVFIPGWVGARSGRTNRKWCARAGRLEVQQVVEGGGCI